MEREKSTRIVAPLVRCVAGIDDPSAVYNAPANSLAIVAIAIDDGSCSIVVLPWLTDLLTLQMTRSLGSPTLSACYTFTAHAISFV